jgi:hypothetical protein
MHPLVASVSFLAISTIYIVWNTYRLTNARREQVLRERVAYMLWVAANRED